jgi:hypothetical protein
MKRLAIAAVGLALVTTFFMWSTLCGPVGPTWAQGPTPLPGGGLDKTLAYDVHVANHESGYLGVFDQFQCQWATVYIEATLNESDTDGTFDLRAWVSDSPDPYDPLVGGCGLGYNLVMGYPAGTWKTFYPFTPGAGPLFCNAGSPVRQYVHFSVFSNQAGRYVAEVHCRPTYPSELPTPTPTPTPLAAVGGIAELPDVAGGRLDSDGTSSGGMGGATYAVLAGAAAGVLALAVLATLSVKKRGAR